MNAQNAREYMPLVQALANGLTIQKDMGNAEWEDSKEIHFDMKPEFYRIKPEPRTFEIRIRKSDGAVCRDVDEYINNEWERITVQEVLK